MNGVLSINALQGYSSSQKRFGGVEDMQFNSLFDSML